MARRRVVITGMGTVNPLARDVETYWRRLLDGESGIRRVARFDPAGFTSQIGGEVVGWKGIGEDYVHRRELKRFDAFTLYAMGAAIEAVQACGIDFDSEDKQRCGILIGSGFEVQTFGTRH